MDKIFKDLERLGLKNVIDVELFKHEPKKKSKEIRKVKVIKEVDEAAKAQMYIYQRKMDCPVCQKSFQTPSIRIGRIRFKGTELDLRPQYVGVDPLIYEVVVCHHCGYAATNKEFKNVSDIKKKAIIENISRHYIPHRYNEILTYEEGVERYKLALLNSAVGGDSSGIKAYLCLKISWLYRGWQESIEEVEPIDEELINALKNQEKDFAEKAYEGFKLSYANEQLPIMGIDDMTMEYLIGELARRHDDLVEARQWLGKVLSHFVIPKRLREKVFESKSLLNEAIKKEKAEKS